MRGPTRWTRSLRPTRRAAGARRSRAAGDRRLVGRTSRRGHRGARARVRGHEDAGRAEDAARVAVMLAYQAFRRLAGAVGGGWVAQAHRLLEGLPDSPLRAHIGVYRDAPGPDGGTDRGGHRAGRSDDGHGARARQHRRALHGDELQGHGRAHGGTLAERSRPDRRGRRGRVHRAGSTFASRATSTATRSRHAGTLATSSAPRSGPRRPSAGCGGNRSAAIPASARCIARSSRCCAASGRKPSRRRARRARSSSGTG